MVGALRGQRAPHQSRYWTVDPDDQPAHPDPIHTRIALDEPFDTTRSQMRMTSRWTVSRDAIRQSQCPSNHT